MRIALYGFFLLSPLLLLNYLVMPELDKMKDFYSNIDVYANQAAGTKTDLHADASSSYTRSH